MVSAQATPTQHEEDLRGRRLNHPAADTDRGSLVRVTVNLTSRSLASLNELSSTTGLTKTDAINRALQFYAWVEKMIEAGHDLKLVTAEGEEMRILLV